jgi:hypothetical protein
VFIFAQLLRKIVFLNFFLHVFIKCLCLHGSEQIFSYFLGNNGSILGHPVVYLLWLGRSDLDSADEHAFEVLPSVVGLLVYCVVFGEGLVCWWGLLRVGDEGDEGDFEVETHLQLGLDVGEETVYYLGVVLLVEVGDGCALRQHISLLTLAIKENDASAVVHEIAGSILEFCIFSLDVRKATHGQQRRHVA